MAQQRFWNFRDDDSTFLMDRAGILTAPAGLYKGFDYTYSGLTVTLNHVKSVTLVNQDLTITPKVGVWKSPQGVIVVEDAPVSLTVAAPSSSPRIDLIVGEHSYVEAVGGVTAIYKVIQGTPSVTPVAPALTSAAKQVVLGTLTIPAGGATLDGAVYERATPPDFNGSDNLVHKKGYEAIGGVKIFSGIGLAQATGELDTPTHIMKLNGLFGFYNFPEVGGGVDFMVLSVQAPVGFSVGQTIWMQFNQRVMLNDSGIADPFQSGTITAEKGEKILFRVKAVTSVSGSPELVKLTLDVLQRDGALLQRESVWRSVQSFQTKAMTDYNATSKVLTLPSGNVFRVARSGLGNIYNIRKQEIGGGLVTDFPVGAIIEIVFYKSTTESSGVANLLFGQAGTGAVLSPYMTTAGSLGMPDPPIGFTFRPNGLLGLVDKPEATVRLLMGEDGKWRFMATPDLLNDIYNLTYQLTLKMDKYEEPWTVVGTSDGPAYASGDLVNPVGTNTAPLRFKKDALGMVIMDGIVSYTVSSGASTITICTLPVGYRPDYLTRQSVALGGSTLAQVTIKPSGVVQIVSASAIPADYIYFTGVTFVAE